VLSHSRSLSGGQAIHRNRSRTAAPWTRPGCGWRLWRVVGTDGSRSPAGVQVVLSVRLYRLASCWRADQGEAAQVLKALSARAIHSRLLALSLASVVGASASRRMAACRGKQSPPVLADRGALPM
jgi:hypothetical protein